MDEVCEMMNDRGIDVLCVNETKRKGRDVTAHGMYTAYWSGVDETERACQGVGVILSERMGQCVKEYECVSPRLLWMRMKVGLKKLFVLGVYAPDMSKPTYIREQFWDMVRLVLMKCKENENIIMLGDFNVRVGAKRSGYERILGTFGDERINENGEDLLTVCVKKNLFVANTFFRHKRIHMYTWERGDDRSMIDFIIVDERMRSAVVDTRVYRGSNVGTDHYLVLCRINGLFRRWRHRTSVSTTALQRIRIERLQDEGVKEKYKCRLRENISGLNELCMNDLELKNVWNNIKKVLVDAATEVCGVSKRTNERKSNTLWWDDEVRMEVEAKKRAWLDLLATKAGNSGGMNDEIERKKADFRRINKRVKEVVERKKQERIDKNDRRISDNFQANIKMFWKLVRTARGISKQPRINAIRDENGCMLNDEVSNLKRWKEYFESVFKSEESSGISEIKIPEEVERGREISVDEIMKAMKSMKAGKAAGYDRVSLEMLRAGEGVVTGLLHTLFNLYWELKRVPEDWCKAVIVSIYKGKGSQQDCKNYRGISLLSIVGKLYAKVLIERVMEETDGKIWDVQAGFRKGMGCTDQVFSMRMIAEKFLAKNQKVFCAFMDLEKAYDRVDRNVLWQTLNSFGLSAGLIQALRSLYRDSSACVRINGVYSDWFGIHKGVRQGCVASPWLFNLFMDSCLQTLKVEECGLRMGESTVKCLLYADDQVIFASSAAELQMMVTLMNWSLKERGMKVNASKTKVMVF
ncbi:unnamed protein product, partial [Parnassius mnemosyne]